MPKIYRVMKGLDGKPTVGDRATDLGVRVPTDIQPNADGKVSPGTGGISVAPTLHDLPLHRLPKRLQHLVKEARGVNDNLVWSMGAGDFAAGIVADQLRLRPDPIQAGHGFVEPETVMALEDFRAALAATRDSWTRDETG